jgi:hypothetical protein
LGHVDRLATRIDESKWGIDDSSPLPGGSVEILELEGFEVSE